MTEPKSTETSYRWQILQKEIDLIHDTIKNLDDIIYKTRNFAWLMWGGSLLIIVQFLDSENIDRRFLVFCTVVIPSLFWLMDFQWRKHLRYASEREKIISKFINSENFSASLKDDGLSKFPLLDPVGWIYTWQSEEADVQQYRRRFANPVYIINRKKYSKFDIAFYKDAGLYFSVMIGISILFGFFYPSTLINMENLEVWLSALGVIISVAALIISVRATQKANRIQASSILSDIHDRVRSGRIMMEDIFTRWQQDTGRNISPAALLTEENTNAKEDFLDYYNTKYHTQPADSRERAMSDEIHIYLHQLHALWNRYKNKEFSLDQIMEKFATSAKMDRVLIELYLEAHWKEHNQLDKDLHERFWHYVPEFVTAARNWKRPDAESKNPPDRLSG